MATLWDVMDHYNRGGTANPFLDGGIHRLGLSESQIDDVVAFMATLTSPEYEALGKREYTRQLALSRKHRPERKTALAMGHDGDASDSVQKQGAEDPAKVGSASL
jgi:cytochrome c peroxidase